MNSDLHFDYTAVGHITVDVLEDGSRRPGGTAFYSALQAARLGLRTLIVTRGVPREIEQLLEPYSGELELRVSAAAATTTLRTFGSAAYARGPRPGANGTRRQRLLAWAGPLAPELALDTAILHLAPIARESPERWRGPAAFVGLTAQGLAREWSATDGAIELRAPAPTAARVAADCDAVVVSEHERASCARLIADARAAGAVVVVTAAARPNTVLAPDGTSERVSVPAIEQPVDDIGAGDVFAAALFVELAGGRTPLQAASFANAAAAVRMAGDGAGAIGERAAIEQRLSRVALGR